MPSVGPFRVNTKIMIPPHTFPLSPINAKRAMILLAVYGIVVIASAGAYILLSGDRRLPLHFVLLLLITSVSSWGIRAGHRWAWGLAALFAAWQIYSGVSNAIVLLNAGVIHAPTPAKIILGFVALRTVILLVLFMLLLFFSDREKIYA
jgi:hypothetical protein